MKNDKKLIFVTGMFRSGTTLMGKILSTHPGISFASDAFRPFFNFYRSSVASSIGQQIPDDMPLGDYFFDTMGLRLFRTIQNAELSVSVGGSRALSALRESISKRGFSFSPKTSERVSEIRGETYAQVFASMMALTKKCFGAQADVSVGLKEVWCAEFVPSILKSYPRAKCLLLVRDPRAIFASRNVLPVKYPWLFLIRQWRKLTGLALLYSKVYGFQNSVMLLKYEDLVSEPKQAVRRICDFLEIPYYDCLVDAESFQDGSGEKWVRNSSYGSESGITVSSIEKWNDVLTPREISFVERCCWHEMALCGYLPRVAMSAKLVLSDFVSPLVLSSTETADWIKSCWPESRDAFRENLLPEIIRNDCMRETVDLSDPDARELIDSLFLDQNIFLMLKQAFMNKK